MLYAKCNIKTNLSIAMKGPVLDAEGSHELIYFVSGMWCSTCAKNVRESVARIDGVVHADINYASKLLVVKVDPSYSNSLIDETIQDKIGRTGFGIKRQSDGWLQHFGAQLRGESNRRITWSHVSVVLFLAMWSSMFALSGYMGGLSEEELFYIHFASSMFGLPAIVMGATPYARSGLRALIFSRLLTLDFFIFIGAASAFGITAYSIFKGLSISYADSGSMILGILLLTKKIENSMVAKTTAGILFQLQPKADRVHVLKNGCWTQADVTRIRANDLVRIEKNETVPLDGAFVGDIAYINNHLMNGENSVITLKKGDDVFAGAIAQSPLLIRVTSPLGLRKIDLWAERALLCGSGGNRIQERITRMESGLVYIAFGGAFLIASVQGFRGAGGAHILESFFVGILIFCPCLFASIMPLAKQIAHLSLLKSGVMCSRIDALLDLSNVKHFCFDKTGTLQAVESQFIPYQGGESAALYLSDLAAKASHVTLRGLPKMDGTKLLQGIEEIPGQGVVAWAEDGNSIIVGRPGFLKSRGVNIPSGLESAFSFVALNFELAGVIVRKKLYDKKSKVFLKRLLNLTPDSTVSILSGDPDSEAGKGFAEIGSRVEYHGNLSPEGKARLVESPSMFIGDGLNDTMALSKADVSFRIGHRMNGLSPVDFQLQRPDLNLVLSVFMYSKKYKKVLVQTCLAAALYNVGAITLAIWGRFSPLGAVVTMTLSFSLMLLSVFRLKTLEDFR